jgi:hypothetical protein
MNDVVLLTSVVDVAAKRTGSFRGPIVDGDHRAFFVEGYEQVISLNLICIKSCSA